MFHVDKLDFRGRPLFDLNKMILDIAMQKEMEGTEIIVEDLVCKYKASKERNDTKYADAFAIVLRFYLTKEEFEKYTAKRKDA